MAPATVFCRACDYPLTGVPTPICPECGRAFDPADPKTFAARPHTRRRKWLKRAAWLLGIIALVELFAPSRILRLTFAWENPDGTTQTSAARWCLVAPKWLPLPYPQWRCAPFTEPRDPSGLRITFIERWEVGPFSVQHQAAWTARLFANAGSATTNVGRINGISIIPQNLETLSNLVLAKDGEIELTGSLIVTDSPAGPVTGTK